MSVALEEPPLLRVAEDGREQDTAADAEQERLSVPANPLTDAKLMVVVPLLPTVTGTLDELGTKVKSERGLAIAPPLLSVKAEEEYVLSPVYWSVTKFAPWARNELFILKENEETVPELEENETCELPVR